MTSVYDYGVTRTKSLYDYIRSPLQVSGRTVQEVACPMLTAARCNHDLQRGRPRYVHVTGDARMYGDALEAVNSYEQRLGNPDDLHPAKTGAYAEVCLIGILKRQLKDAGLDAVVLLEGNVVRCRHSAEVVKRIHADAMVKAGRPKNPNVSRQSADVRMMSDAQLVAAKEKVRGRDPSW